MEANIFWIISISLGQSKRQSNSYMVQNVHKNKSVSLKKQLFLTLRSDKYFFQEFSKKE